MGFLRRDKRGGPSSGDPQLAVILAEGTDLIEQVGRAHRERWGLGTADSWDVDQQTGVIRWSFPDKTVEAPAQMLGSHSPSAGSWLWAWANETVLPAMRRDAERVRAWAEANGHANLTKPKIDADEEVATTLATIAFRVTNAAGFYHAPARASTVFLTFGPVTITAAGGQTETFNIRVED